jgi:N-acetylglucosamine kinase-like BadF-type ATPase
MLLEKSKDSESSNRLVEQKMSTLADNLTSLSKSIKEERAKDIKEVAEKVIQNNQENKKLYEELLSKAVNFIAEKNQESNKKIEQIKSWFLVSFMFHVITLVILAIILKR